MEITKTAVFVRFFAVFVCFLAVFQYFDNFYQPKRLRNIERHLLIIFCHKNVVLGVLRPCWDNAEIILECNIQICNNEQLLLIIFCQKMTFKECWDNAEIIFQYNIQIRNSEWLLLIFFFIKCHLRCAEILLRPCWENAEWFVVFW